MKFAKNIYFGELVGKDKLRVKSELKKHKSQFGVYVIVLSDKPDDILEIIPAWELNSETYWKYHEDDLKVVGFAITKTEAFLLTEEIFMDIYNKADIFNAKSYFEFK